MLSSTKATASHPCVICQETWPEHLMVRHAEHRFCCPCHAKLKDEAFLALNAKTLSRLGIRRTKNDRLWTFAWLALSLILLTGLLLGGVFDKYVDVRGWLRFGRLGHVMMSNTLPFQSGRTVSGPAFLVKSDQGTLAVMPAVALPAPPTKTIAPPPDAPVFERATLTPVHRTDRVIRALRFHGAFAPGQDFWLLDPDLSMPGESPVLALAPETREAKEKEPVRVVRRATAGGQVAQAYTEGRVDGVFVGGARLTISLKARVPMQELIGSPVMNTSGKLMGVVQGFGEPADGQGKVGFLEVQTSKALLERLAKP